MEACRNHSQAVAIQFHPRHAAAVVTLPTLCSDCHLKALCLPCRLDDGDVARLDHLRFARRRVKEGQALYRVGDAFHFLYAVRSGTFKSAVTLADGREQVMAFQMAGELIGLDGLAQGTHATAAIALEDSEICAIPYAQLREIAASSPGMLHTITRLMSQEIVREHTLMMLLATMSAEERVAAFLLDVSRRMQARGWSPREFHLRMSRAEIGSYLGIKLETVSRTLSAFQQRGLLDVDKKHVRIADLDALSRAFEVLVH